MSSWNCSDFDFGHIEIFYFQERNLKCRAQSLKYWAHILRRPNSHFLRRALNYSIPRKFKRGRPCFTWHHTINRAIRRSRIRNWRPTINNKIQHNAKCDEIFMASDIVMNLNEVRPSLDPSVQYFLINNKDLFTIQICNALSSRKLSQNQLWLITSSKDVLCQCSVEQKH